MTLLTEQQRTQLTANFTAEDWSQLTPVVKLFTPDAACTWLLATLDPDDGNTAWGLCDLGVGFPELGSVFLSDIAAVRGKLGLPVERDLYATFEMSIGDYAARAYKAGSIQL